jgi:hypothetical protein
MIRYLKEDQNYNNKAYFIKRHTGLLLRDKFDIWTMYKPAPYYSFTLHLNNRGGEKF